MTGLVGSACRGAASRFPATWSSMAAAMLVAAFVGFTPPANAGLFNDDEARRAINDLRARFEKDDAQRARQTETNAQVLDQLGQLRSSMLDLNNQLELMRTENARLRGQGEQLAREVSELQLQMKDLKQATDERVRRLEPQKTSVDGKEFIADGEEIRQYEAAMAQVRSGDFPAAATALAVFRSRYPASGYGQSVLFWLGNSQYGKRDYVEAISSFRGFASSYPGDLRAPEALLAVANCHFELKDAKAGRKVLDELFKTYPSSEAALAGKQRLAAMK